MLKTNDTTYRVKMYKRGRTWVFAGIMTATMALATQSVDAQASVTADATVSPTSESMVTTNTYQDSKVTLQTPVADNQTTHAEPAEIEDVQPENENDTTSDVVKETAVADDTNQATSPKENDIDQVDDTDQAVTESPASAGTTETKSTTATPISAPAPAATPAKTGADVKLKAVKLVKAEVAKPATVKLAHQQKAATIDEWMPNTILQDAVLKSLRAQNPGKTWASVADITQDDMTLLTSLWIRSGRGTYIDGKTDFTLKGLEFATNLTDLSLGTNLDSAPGAYYGDVADLTPLAGLTKLTKLDLQHNRITDVTPLAGLTNVETLYLGMNRIHDFSPLKGNHYQTFHAGSQSIILDPVMVNAENPAAHLKFQFVTIDGNVVQLEPAEVRVGDPVFYHDYSFVYRFYFTGGTGVSDGNGGLYYTDLKEQIPGITEYPGVTVEPQVNNYYMTGKAIGADSYGSYLFAVVQGYDFGEAAGTITVRHQDEQGKELAPDVILDAGVVGEDYTTSALSIEGYTLKTTPANATGKYTADGITVTYVYEKNGGGSVTPPVVTPAADVTMTIHYQLVDGTDIAPTQTISGQPGTNYTTTPREIDGYTLVTTPANANGTFGDADGTVIYVYVKDDAGGEGNLVTDEGEGDTVTASPDDETATQKPGMSVTVAQGGAGDAATGTPNQAAKAVTTATSRRAPTKTAATTLPQTNERRTVNPIVAGAAMLLAVLGLGWGIKRHE